MSNSGYNSFENKISSFYPDFILSTSKDIFVIECKGIGKNDIDNNTFSKIESLYKNIKKMEVDKKVHIIKVGRQKKTDVLSYQLYDSDGYVKDIYISAFINWITNIEKVIDEYKM